MKRGIDYIGIGIGAVIINKEGKLFLSKRGKKAQNERGKWEFPGGVVEFGETFEQAIKREIKEEFGIEIEPVDELAVFNHILKTEHQHWVGVALICKLKSGEPKILEPEKCEQIGWFDIQEIEKLNLAATAKFRLKQLREKFPQALPNYY